MRISLFTFLLIFSLCLNAQEDWQLDTTISIDQAQQVYADHLGNVYLINKWTVTKYSPDFEEKFIYNNPGLGEITYLNIFNPFNVMVYYQDYNQFVFLDNKLNPNLNAFEPAVQGYFDVQWAATFDENDIWFYDQVSDKMYRWSLTQNKELNTSLQVSPLAGSETRPNFMWATLKNVYLNIPDVGILVFDNFGSYQKTFPITHLNEFYLSESSIVFLNKGQLEYFNDFTKNSKIRKLPTIEFVDFCFAEDRIYLLEKGQLKIFTTGKK
ncbi:MAG: hypothetical protein N4A46_16385 [Schleiferiaceae bacterium]|jgi:hypothetical protein|nr:hypothetical protein [Schleiferiaceae bacterium]